MRIEICDSFQELRSCTVDKYGTRDPLSAISLAGNIIFLENTENLKSSRELKKRLSGKPQTSMCILQFSISAARVNMPVLQLSV
jgi:hypothetical protein